MIWSGDYGVGGRIQVEIALAGEKTFGLKSSRDTAIHPLWVCFYHTRHIISVIKSKPGLVKSSVTCPLFPPLWSSHICSFWLGSFRGSCLCDSRTKWLNEAHFSYRGWCHNRADSNDTIVG